MRIIDVSVGVNERMAVFPGEPQVSFNRRLRIRDGASANVSFVLMGCHSGTHVDAPLHFFDSGQGVEALDLEKMMGPARVFDARGVDCITAELLQRKLEPGPLRILFRTRNSERWHGRDSQKFDSSYAHIGAAAAAWLTAHGFVLVGIDYLSVDAYGASSAESHLVLLGGGVVILEGLDLSGVDAGIYHLCCLPVKLCGLDGSPARAVLIQG